MNLKLWKLTRIWLKQGGCRLFLPATSLIEKIELTKQKVIVNKTRRRLDSYYKSSTAKQLIDFTSIELSPSSSNNIPNDGLIPKKELSKSFSQSCLEISVNQLNIDKPLVETFSVRSSQYWYKHRASLLGTAPKIHPKIWTPLPELSDSGSTKPFSFKISNIENSLSAFKSYVSCEISSFHFEPKSISQTLEKTVKKFQERDTKPNKIFHQNMILLQNELLTKNEIVKSLTDIQITILEALSSFKLNQQYEDN